MERVFILRSEQGNVTRILRSSTDKSYEHSASMIEVISEDLKRVIHLGMLVTDSQLAKEPTSLDTETT